MHLVSIDKKITYKVDINLFENSFDGSLNDVLIKGNFIKINDYQFHFLFNNKSYNIDVVKFIKEDKVLVLKVNSVKFNLELKDKYDELLHNLGLDSIAQKKVNSLKAPMPGMILNILVKEGDLVNKGDGLLVLEAMKMENILKAQLSGVVKKISAIKGTAVEKNQILIDFE